MFYERLKRACQDKDISVSQLLSTLGFSTSNGTYWRKGVIPKGEKLLEIAKYLEVSVDYLIRGEAYYKPDNTVREFVRVGEKRVLPYGSDDNQKITVTDRELGRLEGRIEELEKKNAEYKEIIEIRDKQLCNVIEKMSEQVERMSKQQKSNRKNQ